MWHVAQPWPPVTLGQCAIHTIRRGLLVASSCLLLTSPGIYPCHSLCLEWHPQHRYQEIYWSRSMTTSVLFCLCPQEAPLCLASKQVFKVICWISEWHVREQERMKESLKSQYLLLAGFSRSWGTMPQLFLCASTAHETSCQSRFYARYWMLGAGAPGRPRGMVWGGRRVQDGEHMYTCGGFILIFGKTNTIM